MEQKPLSILISGAGVAGTSLALMLARHPSFKLKPNITLIERSPVPRTTGQAVDIRGPGVDTIRFLGLEPEIKARHTSETGLAFMNGRGDMVARFDATGDAKNQSATSEYEILRGDLTALLLNGVHEVKEKGADVNIVYGESIASLEDSDNGVEVYFENGKLEQQKFDVVVAADGIASKTRSLIFGKEDHRDHVKPSGMYMGFFTVPRIAGDDELWKWCNVPNGMAMHLRPHGNKQTMGVYLTVVNPTKDRNPELEAVVHADVDSQKAYLRQRFHNIGWQSERFLDGLDKADDFYMTHWCEVRTPQWTRGRCVILGDSAFATMGIGTSLAMTGAFAIAGELSKINTSDEVPTALTSYETLLRPLVAKHEMTLPGFPQLANPQTALGVRIFHFVLGFLAAIKTLLPITWLLGGEKKDDWKLPDYGWKSEA
ncbi:FAD/NAD(P)-binding domain-containing protein [Corynespora cassiicola Philippines]|uniref:FAD/NAD(P)-binding domain-containing protein n=1 Tax=Corynespora cassiicola Philippines TaxID=1448308 RepID=A0A2T2N4P6_CORCC|nr:FAD/NAD(P)-binding domain-containing protein [Corynespora cassiicola Philippines]